MKHIFGVFLALFVVGGAYAETATVKEVIDGDTIKVTMVDSEGNDVVKEVRLANSDSPEMGLGCDSSKQLAKRAQARAKALMPQGAKVQLKNVKDDEFTNRIDANVILSDGRDVGAILIKENLAHSFDGKKRASWCKQFG